MGRIVLVVLFLGLASRLLIVRSSKNLMMWRITWEMCLITTFSGLDSGGMVEGNDHPGPAPTYFDSVKYYPGAASWNNGGAALNSALK